MLLNKLKDLLESVLITITHDMTVFIIFFIFFWILYFNLDFLSISFTFQTSNCFLLKVGFVS